MACRVIAELHVVEERRGQHHLGEVVLGAEEWGGEVEPSVGGEDAEACVLAHGVGEVDDGVRQFLLAATATAGGAMFPVPGLIDAGGGEVVGLAGSVFEFGREVVVEGADVDAGDAGVRRVKAGSFAGGVGVEGVEAGVVAAEDLLVVAKEFFAESSGLDAELGFP